MFFAIQVCEKCHWAGTHTDTVNKIVSSTDATWFCPRCDGEVVCVPLRLTIKDLWNSWIREKEIS